MMGIHSGFKALVKQVSSHVFSCHYLIHRYAFSNLLSALSNVEKIIFVAALPIPDYAIKLVQHLMIFAIFNNTEVRWLLRGEVLNRVQK